MHGGELIGCDTSMHLSHRGLLTLDTLGMLEREEEEQPATQQPLSQSMPPEGAREGLLPEVENDGSTSHRESKNNAKRRIAYYINEENKHDASVYAALRWSLRAAQLARPKRTHRRTCCPLRASQRAQQAYS